MSIYYFENENGTFFSEDGKRRFIRLSGKEAYDYMRENKSGDSYFVQTVTDDTEDGEKVFVEVPKSSVSVYRGGTYHALYLSKMRKKKRYRLVSLYHPTEDGDGTAVVDKYSDDGHTVEDRPLIVSGRQSDVRAAVEQDYGYTCDDAGLS